MQPLNGSYQSWKRYKDTSLNAERQTEEHRSNINSAKDEEVKSQSQIETHEGIIIQMTIHLPYSVISQEHEADELGVFGPVSHVFVGNLADAVLYGHLHRDHQAFHYELSVLCQQMKLVDRKIVPKVPDGLLKSSLR